MSVPWADKLKFVATFGAEDPFNQRGKPPVAIKRDLVLFICFGSEDEDAVYDSETCRAALEKAGARSVTRHVVDGLDHHMPKNGEAVGNSNGAAYVKMMELLAEAAKPYTVPKVAPTPAPAPVVDISDSAKKAIEELAPKGMAHLYADCVPRPDLVGQKNEKGERIGRNGLPLGRSRRAIDDLMNDPDTKLFVPGDR